MPEWSIIARRIRVPAGFMFAVLYLWFAKPSAASILIATVLIVPGLILRGSASGHLQKNERLAISGPYAYTRNPLYLGSFILGAGFAVAAQSLWIAVAMAVVFTALYAPVIRSEEDFLREHFHEFADYERQVPRFFPRVRARRNGCGAFSWDLYRKHREYNAIVGAAAVMAVLIAKLHWNAR